MEKKSTQQEILLFTNTRFCERIGQRRHKSGLSYAGRMHEELEDACWKGLIPLVLPELTKTGIAESISLWEINRATSFLDLQFAELPGKIDNELSVNPYLFLGAHRLN